MTLWMTLIVTMTWLTSASFLIVCSKLRVVGLYDIAMIALTSRLVLWIHKLLRWTIILCARSRVLKYGGHGRLMLVVFSFMSIKHLREIPTGLPLRGDKYRWGIKISRFSTNKFYILQTIQDSAHHSYYRRRIGNAPELSNGTIFNDLEWPLTKIWR